MADNTPAPPCTQETLASFKQVIDQAVDAYNFYITTRDDGFKAPEQIQNAMSTMRNAYFLLSGFVLGRRDELTQGLSLVVTTAKYNDLIGGILIFSKYDHIDNYSAEHDIIYAGPSPANVSEQDKEILETFGWYVDDSYDCFYHYP